MFSSARTHARTRSKALDLLVCLAEEHERRAHATEVVEREDATRLGRIGVERDVVVVKQAAPQRPDVKVVWRRQNHALELEVRAAQLLVEQHRHVLETESAWVDVRAEPAEDTCGSRGVWWRHACVCVWWWWRWWWWWCVVVACVCVWWWWWWWWWWW
jgi:hypothetical protein